MTQLATYDHGGADADFAVEIDGSTAGADDGLGRLAAPQPGATRATWLIGGLLAAGVLLSSLIGLRIVNRIREAVQGVVRVAGGLAERD